MVSLKFMNFSIYIYFNFFIGANQQINTASMDQYAVRFSSYDDNEDEEPSEEAMLNRQSVIKFKDCEDEDDLEREVNKFE